MSFTTEIKNEICSNNYSKLENICLLSGFKQADAPSGIVKTPSAAAMPKPPNIFAVFFISHSLFYYFYFEAIKLTDLFRSLNR